MTSRKSVNNMNKHEYSSKLENEIKALERDDDGVHGEGEHDDENAAAAFEFDESNIFDAYDSDDYSSMDELVDPNFNEYGDVHGLGLAPAH